MRRNKGIVILVLILVVVVGIFAYVTMNKENPEAALDRFETAYNTLNLDKMLDSFDPQVMAPYKSGYKLANSLLGMDINDIIQTLPLVDYIDPSFDFSDSMPKIDFKVNSKSIDGDVAVLNVTCVMKSGNETESVTMDIQTVKVEGEWYIAIDPDDIDLW